MTLSVSHVKVVEKPEKKRQEHWINAKLTAEKRRADLGQTDRILTYSRVPKKSYFTRLPKCCELDREHLRTVISLIGIAGVLGDLTT